MGQKVSPNGLRLGINKDWEAKWYSNKKDFAKCLEKDIKIRKYLEKSFLFEYHLASQSLLIPSLSPLGFTFCPILVTSLIIL